MGENTSQIEREIRAERTELGRNLRELETKARDMTDWRTHHRNNPGLSMGLAFSGGFVLGLLTLPSRRAATRDFESYEEPFDAPAAPSRRRLSMPRVVTETRDLAGRQLGQTWEHIASALLGVASAKAVELVAEMIPGFRDHYEGGPVETGARDPIRHPSGY